MTVGQVKNWAEFQHYKDRSPPWIKLHRGLLDDFNFTSLPLASKALAPLLWLLAAESSDGSVSLDPEWLAWRLRIPVDDVREGLSPLIERGFLIAASKPLAPRKQVAIPEGEREGEGETEGERAASKKSKPKGESLLADWLDALPEGEAAIPADGAVFAYAAKIGLPSEYVALAWQWFKSEMGQRQTRQANWRGHFFNAVKGNWPKYWFADDAGGWGLTTAGKQAQRAAQ
jgi:hypothetical protein